jgi:hypothetical protein
MSCEPIKMPDGTVVLANVKKGQVLTAKDRQVLAEWVQFCRDRRAKQLELRFRTLAGNDQKQLDPQPESGVANP